MLFSEHEDGVVLESHALALATDGNIYALQTTNNSGTTTWTKPKLFLPGDLSIPGTTWPTPDGSGQNEIVATGVTSPSFYTNTIHITTTDLSDPTKVWHSYVRQFDGIVEEVEEINGVDTATYIRSDIQPDGGG